MKCEKAKQYLKKKIICFVFHLFYHRMHTVWLCVYVCDCDINKNDVDGEK